MGVANFPFPSFTLLLTTERVVVPGPSYVFRLAPLVASEPDIPQHTPILTLMTDNNQYDDVSSESDSITDIAYHHSHTEESGYAETILFSTDKTESVRTTIVEAGLPEGEVGVGMNFKLPFSKTRPTSRSRLRSFLKRLFLLK